MHVFEMPFASSRNGAGTPRLFGQARHLFGPGREMIRGGGGRTGHALDLLAKQIKTTAFIILPLLAL